MNQVKVVIPCYNEGKTLIPNIESILAHSLEAGSVSIHLLLVNDGSSDNTVSAMSELADRHPGHIEYLSFVRNFGKEAAIFAGLLHCSDADAVIVINADLKHPPELIPGMIEAWQSGYRVVEARKSVYNRGSHSQDYLNKMVYKLMQKMAHVDLETDSDFKLLDQEVILQYLDMPEKSRFFKGLIKWLNYDTKALFFEARSTPNRASRWAWLALTRHAISALTSFSSLPLQLVTLTGLGVFILSAIFASISLFMKLTGTSTDSFPTVITLLALFSSGIMFSLGLIGIYIGKIYEELKDRPIYIMDHRHSRINLHPDRIHHGVKH